MSYIFVKYLFHVNFFFSNRDQNNCNISKQQNVLNLNFGKIHKQKQTKIENTYTKIYILKIKKPEQIRS